MIQYTVGGVTQLASIVSCVILVCVLLWIAPVFECLPRVTTTIHSLTVCNSFQCILASIIVVALKGMVMKVTTIKKCWHLSKWDSFVWIVTFSATLMIDIALGLGAGVAVSLLSLFVQGNKPYTCLLGVVPNTDLYLDMKRYQGVRIETPSAADNI